MSSIREWIMPVCNISIYLNSYGEHSWMKPGISPRWNIWIFESIEAKFWDLWFLYLISIVGLLSLYSFLFYVWTRGWSIQMCFKYWQCVLECTVSVWIFFPSCSPKTPVYHICIILNTLIRCIVHLPIAPSKRFFNGWLVIVIVESVLPSHVWPYIIMY